MRILFVGGDFVRKGGDLLLDVYRRHLRARSELHLVTSADVPAEEGVHVYRNVRPHSPELLRLYRDADVFALPTRADCFAVVLAEAMAAGMPVIATRVAAIPEAVDDGDTGFVVDIDDAEALRDRLMRLCTSEDLRLRMGRRARQVAEARFDMDKNANRIAELLLGIGRD
jgi:glycosyltransferase involved in cell wall biosynthesis